ncbi:MAG: molecular chaperone HtpG [Gloeomargaritaceae cyanobacterium C42_A2020_066]|nr:molecular chaperone HtpG [Gloeomargaritaceae cyanobacterium C42_A2020_066]
MLEQGTITIHTQNIFPIIKKALYSDHEVFFRELISNAVDAIQKLKMVAFAGELAGELGEPEIVISLDKENRTLSIADNGIGMTADEVKKYINQVAFSSAEEFVEKYQKQGSDQPLIGHFGLGFYSAFMVADQVEITTLSYREGAEAVRWQCDGSPNFTLDTTTRAGRGTTVTLTLQESETEFLEPGRIRELVKTYCDFLPVAIKLEGETLNRQQAIWRQSPADLKDEDYLTFYRYLYPFQDDPLLWVHLQTDYPFLLNGVLYFPKLRPDVDVSRSQLKLFCNQVFVSDHCEEILPRFLLPMRGVIDSPDIPLNVSRSALQLDRTVRQIGNFVAKKVADRLKEMYHSQREQYIDVWQDLGTFVKFGCLNDDKFKQQVEDILIFRTTAKVEAATAEQPAVEVPGESGDAWQTATPEGPSGRPAYTTLKEYLARNQARHENRVFYCTDEVAQATYVDLHTRQGLEVLFMDSFIDTHFISFLEREFEQVKFSRVDSDLDPALLSQDQGSELIDPKTNKSKAETVKELFEAALGRPRVTIRTESLKGEGEQAPPAMVLLPESLRRLREMTALMQQGKMEFPEEHTLVVNLGHPLVQHLLTLNQTPVLQVPGATPANTLAQDLCCYIYDLALLAQKGFDVEGMKGFVERSNRVLTQLAGRVAGG